MFAEMFVTFALEIVLQGIWKTGKLIYGGLLGSNHKKIERSVTKLLPILEDMCKSSSESYPSQYLQGIRDLRDKLFEGKELVRKLIVEGHSIDKIKINEDVKKLDESIKELIENHLPVYLHHMQMYLSKKMDVLLDVQDSFFGELQAVREGVEAVGEEVKNVRELVESMMRNSELKDRSRMRAPATPKMRRAFPRSDKHIQEVKNGMNMVESTAMDGAGESTLTNAVCHDNEIKGKSRRRKEHDRDRHAYVSDTTANCFRREKKYPQKKDDNNISEHTRLRKGQRSAVLKNGTPELDKKDTPHGRNQEQIPQLKQNPKEVVLKGACTCKDCVENVKKHLSKIEGVTSVDTEPEKNKVTVTGDITPTELLESIHNIGSTRLKKLKLWPG